MTAPEAIGARWRRAGIALLALLVLSILGTTWLSSSRSEVHDLGTSAELLIVSDAGPVRIRTLAAFEADGEEVSSGGVLVRSTQSWLLRAPKIEQVGDGASSAFRVTCPSRFPCRASLEVYVPSGTAVSIVAADDAVQVDGFAGALSLFAGEGGVSLGAVSGSVSIVSKGPVAGDSLGPAELTIDAVDSDVTLRYLDAPTVLAVVAGNGDVSIVLPRGEDFAVDAQAPDVDLSIPSDPSAERIVSVRSEGAVTITDAG